MKFLIIGLSVLGIILGGLIAFLIVRKVLAGKKLHSAEKQALQKIEDSNRSANKIINKAQSEAQRIVSRSRNDIENEIKSRRDSISKIERSNLDREKHLDAKEAQLLEKESGLDQELEKVKGIRNKQTMVLQELAKQLETIAGMSKEEAEKNLIQAVEHEMKHKAGELIKSMEDKAKKLGARRAQEIITDAIQRTAVDHVANVTTTTVELPDDEMKGRVIGKEGRNIRSFEAATGVDVIIDDSPGTIIISAFDPIRRQVAKIALQKLINDGRIHPARVEEAVEEARVELQKQTIELGEQAAEEINLQFHPKIIELLGKLHFRSSYGQNILSHSLEAAHVAGIIAAELNVNVKLAKRGTLLHDIGKAIDFEREGTHTELGKEVCQKYGESKEILNCIMCHHEEEPPDTIEAVIVMIADAISSARPGARRESMQNYVKRLEKLEGIANSFKGVEKTYAIQAGRELRVMVQPDEVDDVASKKLAFDIARQIEENVDFPGEIRVSIIRETRATELAK